MKRFINLCNKYRFKIVCIFSCMAVHKTKVIYPSEGVNMPVTKLQMDDNKSDRWQVMGFREALCFRWIYPKSPSQEITFWLKTDF